MSHDHLIRQWEILPIETLEENITIIGAGAIGSFTALALAKMGFHNMTVFDFDEVSIENMSCQWYRHKDIGKNKAEALRDLIKDFTEVEIMAVPSAYTEGAFPGIVISAVDSMEVRKNIWENHKDSVKTKFIIDPRMASEYAMMYVMKPTSARDIESYEKTLFADDEGVQERCTARSTMYTATMISGLVAKSVKDIVNNIPHPRVTDWNIKMDSFKSWPSTKRD